MHDDPTTPNGGLNNFERRLAALVPDAGRLEHDRLLWQAGYEAAFGARTARRVNRLLAASTATLAAACMLLGVALIFERTNAPTMIAAPPSGPDVSGGVSQAILETDVSKPPQEQLLALDQRPTAHVSRPGDAVHRLSHLVLRRHGLDDDIDAPPHGTDGTGTVPEKNRPVGARQMLEELLGRRDDLL